MCEHDIYSTGYDGISEDQPCGSVVENLPANAGDAGSVPGEDNPLEKEMAIHSNILAWKIPWTEEPGWSQPTGLQKSQTGQQLNSSNLR